MKRLILFLAFLSLSLIAVSQSNYFFEDFETTNSTFSNDIIPPLGWATSFPDSTGFYWRAGQKNSSSINTGPNMDHTIANDLGLFFYAKPGYANQGDTAYIISPNIDLNYISNPHLSFWYHMYGSSTGSVIVDILYNGIWINNVYSRYGAQHFSNIDPWKEAIIDLSAYSNSIIKIRFRAIAASYIYGNMAIDDIRVYQYLQYDAGVVKIIQPFDTEPEDTYSDIKVIVKNFGYDTIPNYNVIATHNAGITSQQNVSTPLAPNEFDTITLSGFILSNETNQISCKTSVLEDYNTYNDSVCKNYYGLPYYTLYHDDFDSTMAPFMSHSAGWQWGVPDGDVINYAYNGTKVWMTDLNGYYPINRDDYIIIPKTFNFSHIQGATISFSHWVQTVSYADAGQVQYSTNNGITWNTLGTSNDTLGINWYNTIYSTDSWHGLKTEWTTSIYKLTQFDNYYAPLIFRIRFYSDGWANQYDGFAIDNISVNIPKGNYDVGIIEITDPSNGIYTPGSNQNVTVKIKNLGLNTIYNSTIKFIDNNGLITSETWSGALAPDSTAIYTFNASYTIPNNNHSITAFTYNAYDSYSFNDSITQDIQITIGISENSLANFTIGNCMPNPVINNAVIPIEIEQSGIIKFDIYNNLGQIVYSNQYSFEAGENQIEFNTENLASGVYSYGISYKEQIKYGRFSKN